MDSVLVTCPTARCKDYALDAYLEAFSAFTYENKHLMMVDTTKDDEEYQYALMSKSGCNVQRHPENSQYSNIPKLITEVWEKTIIPYAWACGFDWVFHIESDIICPPRTIEKTLQIAQNIDAELISHSYPTRPPSDHMWDQSIGCTMWRKDIFPVGFSFEGGAEYNCRRLAYSRGYHVVQLTNTLDIEHLSEAFELPPESERTGQTVDLMGKGIKSPEDERDQKLRKIRALQAAAENLAE